MSLFTEKGEEKHSLIVPAKIFIVDVYIFESASDPESVCNLINQPCADIKLISVVNSFYCAMYFAGLRLRWAGMKKTS